MSEWTDEQAQRAYDDASAWDGDLKQSGADMVGRALLTLEAERDAARADAEGFRNGQAQVQAAFDALWNNSINGIRLTLDEVRDPHKACALYKYDLAALTTERDPLLLRVAALEGALTAVRRDCGDDWSTMETQTRAIVAEAIDGSTMALRSLLLQMGGLVWSIAAPSVELDGAAIEDGADRIIKGGGKW